MTVQCWRRHGWGALPWSHLPYPVHITWYLMLLVLVVGVVPVWRHRSASVSVVRRWRVTWTMEVHRTTLRFDAFLWSRFLVTGLDRLTPGQHLAVLFFSTRLRNLAFFFVPGVNRASPISTRAKTVDLPGCGASTRSADCLRHVIPPKSGTPSDV